MDMVPVYRLFNTLYYLFMETENEMILLTLFFPVVVFSPERGGEAMNGSATR